MEAALVNRPRPRLLLVDDEHHNIHLLKRIFEVDNDVEVAMQGQSALQAMLKNDYDVILLDLMLPDINGMEILRQIRQKKDMLTLPIILVSAVTDETQIVEAIQQGANDYISKPINVDLMVARVNTQVILKQTMNERHRVIDGLQSANRMKARMMQIASHDLKNPLNNLRMLTAVMRRQAEDYPALTRFLNTADESLLRMLNVVEDFLDHSPLSDPHFTIEIQPIKISPIMEQIITQYADIAHSKNITLVEKVSGTVKADSNRLLQVIDNLVSNAIKYTPKGSTVWVKSSIHENHTWRLSVQDQGPGIPEPERERLFKPYGTTSAKPTGGEDSTGLGLWIVAEMMRLQDGRVGVDFPEDGGSCFWIELPRIEEPAGV